MVNRKKKGRVKGYLSTVYISLFQPQNIEKWHFASSPPKKYLHFFAFKLFWLWKIKIILNISTPPLSMIMYLCHTLPVFESKMQKNTCSCGKVHIFFPPNSEWNMIKSLTAFQNMCALLEESGSFLKVISLVFQIQDSN